MGQGAANRVDKIWVERFSQLVKVVLLFSLFSLRAFVSRGRQLLGQSDKGREQNTLKHTHTKKPLVRTLFRTVIYFAPKH